MRFRDGAIVGPDVVVLSSSRGVRAGPERRSVHPEMYGRVDLPADVTASTRGYVVEVDPLNARVARFTRWARNVNPWAIDIVLGTVFTFLGLLSLFTTSDPHHYYRSPDVLGVLLALGCSAPLFVRRRAPLSAHLACVTGLVFLSVLEYPSNAQAQILLFTSYTVGAYCAGAKRAVGFAAIIAALGVVMIVGIPDASNANIALSGAFFIAAYFFGSTVRNRRLYMDQLEERATLLERESEEEAKRAVADERLRIAQELHDVVAHSMGVIAVQAGVGAHVIDDDPAEAKRSLEAIATTSRGTLVEIRRLLGVLRSDGDAAYQPAPGLADLDRLVADVGGAGLDVALCIDGERGDVPPGVDLTAYRIVQEALTNVLKHAGPAHTTVTVGYEPGALRLEIADDGRGVNGRASQGGHGLLGMRERVGVYGGSLQAGPAPGGGFRVVARLPYGDDE
jgi:signal transduction histidine kinase